MAMRATVGPRSQVCPSARAVKAARPMAVRAQHQQQPAFAELAVSIFAAGMLMMSPPVMAAEPSTSSSTSAPPTSSAPPSSTTSGPMTIAFTRIDPAVSQKVKQRDDMMAWKCKGVNMYDCDGERAAEAEKAWQGFKETFRK